MRGKFTIIGRSVLFALVLLAVLPSAAANAQPEPPWDLTKDYFDNSPWAPDKGQVEGEWTWDSTGGNLNADGTEDWKLTGGKQSIWGGGADIKIGDVPCRGGWNDSSTTWKSYELTLTIANNEDKSKIKYAWISFKTYGKYTGTGADGNIGYKGEAKQKKAGAGKEDDKGWTSRYELWTFEPQPKNEIFKFKWFIPPSKSATELSYYGIRDVKYSTICVPIVIPEPASMLLLVFGAAVLGKMRRI